MPEVAKIMGLDVPAGIPSGLIVLWHGTIANIPSGFIICDGNNSTPNLLARFVEGVATAATNPGATGGAKAKTTSGHTHARSGGRHGPRLDTGAGTNTGLTGMGTLFIQTTNPVGASEDDSISDIRPPYYDVAFLMKT